MSTSTIFFSHPPSDRYRLSTAVVHYYDGTVVNVAQVQANADYLALISRLASPPSPLPETPASLLDWLYLNLPRLASIHDSWEKWRRWLNKKLGRPATPDVAILSNLFQGLKEATERELSQSLSHVAVSAPSLPSLTPEDINDALDYLGLRSWMDDSPFYPPRIVEADAVYAAYGNGLCTKYQDLFRCWDEFDELPTPTVLFISFSRHLLYISIIEPIQGRAFDDFTTDESHLLDFDAGLDQLTNGDVSPAVFWDHIRQQILMFWKTVPRPLSQFLLAGENATHERFLDAVADALAEAVPPAMPVNMKLIADPTFAAARGVALYARRRQEVQHDCTEGEYCDIKRCKERNQRIVADELR